LTDREAVSAWGGGRACAHISVMSMIAEQIRCERF